MKLNINKICFLLLCSIGIALGCFASAVSLLTHNWVLEASLLLCTYGLGILLVNIRRNQPLWISK